MYCLADSDEESSSAGSSDEEEPQEVFTDKALPPGAERCETKTDRSFQWLILAVRNVDEVMVLLQLPKNVTLSS